jgi:hypothetical protein
VPQADHEGLVSGARLEFRFLHYSIVCADIGVDYAAIADGVDNRDGVLADGVPGFFQFVEHEAVTE